MLSPHFTGDRAKTGNAQLAGSLGPSHPVQMSLRLSVVSPLACSGDMYAAVPMITPICVAAAVNVGD